MSQAKVGLAVEWEHYYWLILVIVIFEVINHDN